MLKKFVITELKFWAGETGLCNKTFSSSAFLFQSLVPVLMINKFSRRKPNVQFERVKIQDKITNGSNLESSHPMELKEHQKVKKNIDYDPQEIQNQNLIISAQTIDDLVRIQSTFSSSFNLVNYATLFHKYIKIHNNNNFGKMSGSHIDYKDLLKRPEFNQLILHLKENTGNMEQRTIANFISNYIKLGLTDVDLVKNTFIHLINKQIKLNIKSLSYMAWALAKSNLEIKEASTYIESHLLSYQNMGLDIKALANIFWSISKLNIMNEKIISKIEEEIIQKSQSFDSSCINMIFAVYEKYHKPNWNVLDSLSHRFVSTITKHSVRNMANILQYCSSLSYINHTLFEAIQTELIKRLQPEVDEIDKKLGIIQQGKVEEEFPLEQLLVEVFRQKQLNFDLSHNQPESNKTLSRQEIAISKAQSLINQPSDQTEIEEKITLNSTDLSQLLVACSKLKVIKPQLFEILEYYFIANLSKADSASIVCFAYAHSEFCQELLTRYQQNPKKYLKRSLKNISKYNDQFYEIVLQRISQIADQFAPTELLALLQSASRPLIQKKAVCRHMVQLGLTLIPKLKQNMSQQGYKQLYDLFKLIQGFLKDHANSQINLVKIFKDNNVDVNQLITDFGYLRPQSLSKILEQQTKSLDNEQNLEQKNSKLS